MKIYRHHYLITLMSVCLMVGLIVLAAFPVWGKSLDRGQSVVARKSSAQEPHTRLNTGPVSAQLAVGIPFEDVRNIRNAGGVQVFGSTAAGIRPEDDTFWSQDLSALIGIAEANDYFGQALASGDFNGDGYPDLAIGVPGEDIGSVRDAGAVNVIYGSPDGLRTAGNQGWDQGLPEITGLAEEGDRFGAALASGDFNDDGYDDLAIGVPGEDIGSAEDAGAVAILYGSASGLRAEGNLLLYQGLDMGASGTIRDTPETGDRFANALTVGDFNGDGYDDLAIGVPNEDVGATDAGAVHVLYGNTLGLAAYNNQFWHQGLAEITGLAETGDAFGTALVSGDFDGDGYDDLAIGAPLEDIGSVQDAGAINVIYGFARGLHADGNQGWHQGLPDIVGIAEQGDLFGYALAGGDFNGDGYDDVAIGVPGEDIGAVGGAGSVNVIYGGSTGLTATGNQGWHQNSPSMQDAAEAGDRFGRALAVGDFNQDGYADLAIGIPEEDVDATSAAGAVHVMYGSGSGLSSSGNRFWHQNTPGVEGAAEQGDKFGYALAALVVPEIPPGALHPGADTSINPDTPNTNYGSSLTLNVGAIGEFTFNAAALLRFDLATIPPGATIQTAQLRLYKTNITAGAVPVEVHRVTSSWAEGAVTWNTRPSWDSAVMASTTVGTKRGVFYVWDVTSLVQAWVNGTYPNYGLALTSPTGGGVAFASREQGLSHRPQLIIIYTPPTPTPTFTPTMPPQTPTPTPTPVTPPPTPTLTPTPTPTTALGSIGGRVWEDITYDGVSVPVERGIPNVRVELRQGSVVVASATTTEDGGYRFDNLLPGTYVVDVDDTTVPWYYEWSTGNDPETVVLAPGERRNDVNFGYARWPRIWAYVEVNQAVQTAIFPVPEAPSSTTVDSPVPLLPGKDTVVRYYLMANGRPALDIPSDISLRLEVRTRDGRTLTSRIRPNTGQTFLIIPSAPEDTAVRDNLIREMRADLNKTLNFVIPADQIPLNASRISLTLEDIVVGGVTLRTGTVALELALPRVLGLSIVPMRFLDAPPRWNPPPTRSEIQNNVLPYLRAVYPISRINARWQPTVQVSLNRWLRARGGNPDVVAAQMWTRYRETLPVPGATWSTIFVGARFPGGDGKGYPCRVAFAAPNGNVSAQEIGHSLNFGHINSVHNPGDSEPDTYGHAAIGEFVVSSIPHQTQPPPWGNVGIAAKQRGDGSWEVVLVDPGDPDSDSPGDGDHAHEFMSYGNPRPGTPLSRIFTLQFANGEWISDVMYQRIYDRIRENAPLGCGESASTRGLALAGGLAPRSLIQRQEALIFTASANEKGEIEEVRLTTAPVSEAWLKVDEKQSGPFTLELLDKQDNVLLSRAFNLIKAPGSTQGGTQMAAVALPYVEGVYRILVRRNGQVVAERKASPNPPNVRVLSPNGGEVFSSGPLTIRWQVSDPDAEPLDLLIEYSPDGGNRWQPLGFVSGDRGEITVNIDELAPGRRGLIRIGASDGVNTAEDRSDSFFSVGAFTTTYLPSIQR